MKINQYHTLNIDFNSAGTTHTQMTSIKASGPLETNKKDTPFIFRIWPKFSWKKKSSNVKDGLSFE